MSSYRANIPRLYLYRTLSEFLLVAPVLVPFYESNGLGATQVFSIQAAYSVGLILFEVPSGYFSDVLGRRRTLLLGALCWLVGLTTYALSHSFWAFVVAELTMALGGALRSGTDSALAWESLESAGQASEYNAFEGRTLFFSRSACAVASILGGLLAIHSLRLPFILNAPLGAFMLLTAWSMREVPHSRPRAARPWYEVGQVALQTLRRRELLAPTLFSAVVTSAGIAGIWAYFLFYSQVGIGVGWFGVLFAAFQFSAAFGARMSEAVRLRLGERGTLALLFGLPASFLLLALVQSPWVLPAIFLNAMIWNLTSPVVLGQLNRAASPALRATQISVSAFVGRLSILAVLPSFGAVTDAAGLSGAFGALAGVVTLGLLLAWSAMPRQPSPR